MVRGSRPLSTRLAQVVENLLGALQREGRDDHVAAALESVSSMAHVEFLDGGCDRLVQAVPVGGLHDHGINPGWRSRVAQYRAAAAAEVTGEQHVAGNCRLRRVQKNARRAEDVAGVDRRWRGCRGQCRAACHTRPLRPKKSSVLSASSVAYSGAFAPLLCVPPRAAGTPPGFLLLQMCRVEHHQPRELARRARGDDLAAEAALHEQRDAARSGPGGRGSAARVDVGGVEAERLGVLLLDLAAALVQAAVDQHALARAFDQMTGSGHSVVRAVK